MGFTFHKPHHHLARFVDTYWELKSDKDFTVADKVIPDGCVDLIFNFGNDYVIDSENCVLQNEKAYLGGTITEFKENNITPGTHIIGVRFKPAAFAYLYSFSSLHELTNRCVEIGRQMIPDPKSLQNNFPAAFDAFFSARITPPKHILLPLVDFIEASKGVVSIREMAQTNFTTVRQLERNFKYYIGLSPKEYTNIVRFKFARDMITSRCRNRKISDIALECGYYDLAHLSNAIKKYTGEVPSML